MSVSTSKTLSQAKQLRLAAAQAEMKARQEQQAIFPCARATLLPVEQEPHFSVDEVANIWNVSADTVRRIFRDVVGVLKIGSGKHMVLRIPARILKSEHQRLAA
jgi:Fic family protein